MSLAFIISQFEIVNYNFQFGQATFSANISSGPVICNDFTNNSSFFSFFLSFGFYTVSNRTFDMQTKENEPNETEL